MGIIVRALGASPSEAKLKDIVMVDVPLMKEGLDDGRTPDFMNRVDFFEFMAIMAELTLY